MAQSLARILLHTTFSTKERRPFLRDEPIREVLHRYLGGILTNLDCQPFRNDCAISTSICDASAGIQRS